LSFVVACAGPLCIHETFLEFLNESLDLTLAHQYLQMKSSQVKFLITNDAFCIMQRATAQSRTGIFHGCGVAEDSPGIQRLPQERTRFQAG
jgi:hypothetical protein